jgi:hypothetical protein
MKIAFVSTTKNLANRSPLNSRFFSREGGDLPIEFPKFCRATRNEALGF